MLKRAKWFSVSPFALGLAMLEEAFVSALGRDCGDDSTPGG